LTELTELEELFIANNKFIGSLEPLKNMTNLRKLDILGTDINIGLEYLPTSLEKSCYLAIKESLKKHQIDQISKLFVAVEENEIVKVTNVIEELGSNFNPDICCDEKNKFTLLHMAVARNYPEIAELLLEKGADPNIKDCEGNTPLHFAAEENNLSLLKLLSKKGGNINAVNNYG
jgi:ankyrin repeat protein